MSDRTKRTVSGTLILDFKSTQEGPNDKLIDLELVESSFKKAVKSMFESNGVDEVTVTNLSMDVQDEPC